MPKISNRDVVFMGVRGVFGPSVGIGCWMGIFSPNTFDKSSKCMVWLRGVSMVWFRV